MRAILLSVFILFAATTSPAQPSTVSNRVLQLDGDGDYVELPPGMFDGLQEATVELWVKWERLNYFSQAFSFGLAAEWRQMGLNHWEENTNLQFFIYDRDRTLHIVRVSGGLAVGRWMHLAAVTGPEGMKVYIDGKLAGSNEYGGSFVHVGDTRENYLGRSGWPQNRDLRGQLDEVRVWSVARSGTAIRADLGRRLTGGEPGLLALWNFDDGARDGVAGHHGRLVGDARTVAEPFPGGMFGSKVTAFTGVVRDADGASVANARLVLYRDDAPVAETYSGDDGTYLFYSHEEADKMELAATWHGMGVWRRLPPCGDDRDCRTDLTLRPALSLTGTIRALDGAPQSGVPLMAVSETGAEGPIWALSDAEGHYRFVNLKPGEYVLRCPMAFRYNGAPERRVRVGRGRVTTIDFRFPPAKKGAWRAYDYFSGVPSNWLSNGLSGDASGYLWFVSNGEAVRFDGVDYTSFGRKDGLAGAVRAMAPEAGGAMWFGTDRGVSRFDGTSFASYTAADGLVHDVVRTVLVTRDGAVWIGTEAGVSRFDGGRCAAADESCASFANFTRADGLKGQVIHDLAETRDGELLCATDQGVSRWTGSGFADFASLPENGLWRRGVRRILPTRDGAVWFAGEKGAARFDGARLTHFTPGGELASSRVEALAEGGDGTVWIGLDDNKIWRWGDGEFVLFTEADGLPGGRVRGLWRDQGNVLWAALLGSGLAAYEPNGVVSYGKADGLAEGAVYGLRVDGGDRVWAGTAAGVWAKKGRSFAAFGQQSGLRHLVEDIYEDRNGALWFASLGKGVWRYDGAELAPALLYEKQGGGSVAALFEDRDGALWLGSRNGAYRYVAPQLRHYNAADGLAHLDIRAVDQAADGSVWLGLGRGGAMRYADGDWQHVPLPEDMAAVVLSVYAAADGSVWLGTTKGLLRASSVAGGQRFAFEQWRGEQGLAHDFVEDIEVDGQGRLWIATNGGGVAIWDGVAWSSLDSRDGLPNNAVYAVDFDSQGRAWFATRDGIASYRRGEQKPGAFISAVEADTLYGDLGAMRPFPSHARVRVHYSAVDLKTLPAKRLFRTRVHRGENAAWNPPTRVTAFEWMPTEAGAYTFEVQAIDRDLNYSEPARVVLEVVLPWYRDAWIIFPGGAAFALLVTATLVLGLRTRRQRRETERLREQMLVRERRDREALAEQNAQLEQAQNQLRQLLRQEEQYTLMLRGWAHAVKNPLTLAVKELENQRAEGDPAAAQRHNAAIEERITTVRSTIDRLLNAIVDLQPQEFHVKEELELLLYRTVQRYDGVSFAGEDGEVAPIQADFAKVRMAFENLFVNACQALEGPEGEVGLAFATEGEAVVVSVWDTGPGIDSETLGKLLRGTYTTKRSQGGTGLGLLISRHIFEAHGGGLQIESAPGEGTTMRVTLPKVPRPRRGRPAQ